METGVFFSVALAVLLLLSGCLGLTTPPAPSSNESVTPTTSPVPTPTPTATPSQTATPSPTLTPTVTATSTATLAQVTSLPSVPKCLTAAVPQPGSIDGIEPSEYPAVPGGVTRSRLVNWTQNFETAYFRNLLLADEIGESDGDGEHNLTEASASVEVRGVNQPLNSYVIRMSDFGSRTYASGFFSERWMDVGYVINETHVVRVPLPNRGDLVRVSEGTAVVSCG